MPTLETLQVALSDRHRMRLLNLAALVALPVALGFHTSVATSASPAPSIQSNDNRTPAGTVTNGVLNVRLEAKIGDLQPEGEHNPAITVFAFGEEDRPLQAPGPLIRVSAGTPVHVTLRNSLPKSLRVRGLSARPGLDSIDLAPGATRDVSFTPMTPGTYYYWGRTEGDRSGAGFWNDGQLAGALIVDPPGGKRPDRIMVITVWGDLSDSTRPQRTVQTHMLMNGRSWPYTERLTYNVGDSIFWRVINASTAPHPMHLHGFYYRILSRGDAKNDSVYVPAQQRLAVTELMNTGSTMSLAWSPNRPGNWVFHCHIIHHISADQRLGDVDVIRRDINHGMHNHTFDQMSGLVMGITVRPSRNAAPARVSTAPPQKLRLFINKRDLYFGANPGFSFVLQEGPKPPALDSLRLPGSPIVLTRGIPAEITVYNRTPEMASVHWHGIELESYYDGVGDWSGSGSHIAPPIAPGKSFVVRFTPDRAGTFIYHTHSDEDKQLSSGLYGPLIVLEPGTKWNPDVDRVLLFAAGGPKPDAVPMLNGSYHPRFDFRTGKTYRLRLIGIAPSDGKNVRLLSDTTVQSWRAFAKDGATLPASQATVRPARLIVNPGETYDFEFTPTRPGALTLEVITTRRNVPPTLNSYPIEVK